jgi:NADH dehydrogenase
VNNIRKALEQMPHVVVVGGGFGGTHAAHTLRNAPVRVTVIDRTNHSIFHPLLYQVASAGLSSDEIAVPIRFLLRRQRNSEVMMAEVTAVDVRQRRLWMSTRQLSYDYLILATGSHYSYFGHNDWPRFAPSLKTTADAVRIRRKILQAFEQAELEMDADTVSALLTFVLIGAGPTGVEMSGAISELARFALVHEYRHIDTLKTRIVLLEAGPRILPAFPAALARKAEEELERKGVEVRIGAAATAIDEKGVIVNGGERIRSHNVIWAAGVKGTALGQSLGVETDRMGRVKVLPDLSIPDHPEIFVIGDLMVIEQNGKSFSPGLAPVAVQQGQYVGRLIARRASAGVRTWAVSLSGLGQPRDDRARICRRGLRRHAEVQRKVRLGVMVDGSPLLSHEFVESNPSVCDMDLGLFHLPAGRAHSDSRQSGRGRH